MCHVKVKGNQGKVCQLIVNGKGIEGNFIPYSLIENADSVEIIAEFKV